MFDEQVGVRLTRADARNYKIQDRASEDKSLTATAKAAYLLSP